MTIQQLVTYLHEHGIEAWARENSDKIAVVAHYTRKTGPHTIESWCTAEYVSANFPAVRAWLGY